MIIRGHRRFTQKTQAFL